MRISLLTPTGGRPDTFAICEALVKKQTVKPYEWVVVDDCTPPIKCTMGQKYIRGPRDWYPGLNTQRFNLEEGVKHLTGDVIVPWEDDDWMASNYLEVMSTLINYTDIVGLANSKYYNLLIPGYKNLHNYAHASLTHTVFKAKLLPEFKKAIDSGDLYCDIKLWETVRNKHYPMVLLGNSKLGVGIKGMPGRPGITGSHSSTDYYVDSRDYKKLQEWIGEDYKFYLPYLKKGKQHAEAKRNL